MQSSDDLSRTTKLLAERWASRFCTIQRRLSFGEWLKFVGAGLAVAAWFTFLVLAKGTVDFQASDFVLPGVMTAIGIVIAALGFFRTRRAGRELQDAIGRLALDLDQTPPPGAEGPG